MNTTKVTKTTKVTHWAFYAESLLFQSPHPSELPLPVFHEDGSLVDGFTSTVPERKKTVTVSPKVLEK